MKKVIALILIVLPVLLIVMISFAGRIYSTITVIDVEKVSFVDEFEVDLPDDKIIVIDKDDIFELNVAVKPELASNKSVKYVSMDKSIAIVNSLGVITGVNYGTTQITVITNDGAYTDTIIVKVGSVNVKKVIIEGVQNGSLTELANLTLIKDEQYMLRGSVLPITSSNKNVTWTCSNTEICEIEEKMVDGVRVAILKAKQRGICEVTLTSVDGGLTSVLNVTVNEGVPKLVNKVETSTDYYFNSTSNIYIVYTDSIELNDLVMIDSTLTRNNLVFTIQSGNAYASLPYNGSILQCNQKREIITILVSVKDTSYLTYIKVVFTNR